MSNQTEKIKALKKMIKENQHPAQTKDKKYLETVAASLQKKFIEEVQKNK